ncbi:MAG: crotonase/enoyl-CoA hydratase family protein [Sedimenticola sp.]|nr:crotonase/enoyl-CoA hydratase family protein [Sedimenticola sp.]
MTQQQIKLANAEQYTHVDFELEPAYHAVWVRLRYPARPCISVGLIDDLEQVQNRIARIAKRDHKQHSPERLRYQILGSAQPGVFCLGGDLELFMQLIRRRDQAGLERYAKRCIDILFDANTGYGLPFTTIALVQGETLGGGFEAALSANVLIAEKSARFGFPETVFGMFPGMGAFSFLARRIAPAMAKRIIASGRVYTADELFQMGVVDQVVDDGKGVSAVHEFIRHQQVRSTGFEGLDRIVEQFNPITRRELMDAVHVWVDTAMRLTEKNMRLMAYLVNAQNKRWSDAAPAGALVDKARSA